MEREACHTAGAWPLRPLHSTLCCSYMSPFDEVELPDAQCYNKLTSSMATHVQRTAMAEEVDSDDGILSDPEEIQAQEKRLECRVGVLRERVGLSDGTTLRQVAHPVTVATESLPDWSPTAKLGFPLASLPHWPI